jgi:hypothetical protein
VTVRRHEVRGIAGAARRGPVLEVSPRLAAHKAEGATCPGSGEIPAETRYTPGRELASWVAVNGAERVA